MEQTFGKILVAVDGTYSCLRAMEIAAVIAKKFSSKITVVHVISHDFMHPELKANHQLPELVLNELDKSHKETGIRILRGAEEFFKEEQIEISSELVKAQDPAEKILEMIEDGGYDLLILGNLSDVQTKHFTLGHVAKKISLHANVPVLIVKRKTEVRKLLVAVDGSANADKALEYAIQFSRPFKAIITLLHVEETGSVKQKGVKTAGEHILANAAAKHWQLSYNSRLDNGEPAETILKVANQENHDLIVIGSRGLGSVKRFLLGSVSAEVSMHAQCSVLIIR